MVKPRLDVLLVERGLVPTRERARALILAGQVRVNAQVVTKAGSPIGPEARIELAVPDHPYVGRGGVKLAHALDAFGIDPKGCHALDVGASTGGFTDVLLRRGAASVVALDVGHGQLDWGLRNDPRVLVREGVNARSLTQDDVPHPVRLVTIDVAFISLRHILPALPRLLDRPADIVALVKPQFEAGRGRTDHGVVRDPAIHREVLERVVTEAGAIGLGTRAVIASPITGPEGNREFLLDLAVGPGCAEIAERIADVTGA
jgi:23S rRNA (cytidine1920-2'-O)/16S rRNA (cytidine1409-2'-O)-methyltransferase